MRGHRIKKCLRAILDENEFLSPYGVRGMSMAHRDRPYTLNMGGHTLSVGYVPGDSDTGMFGGNSNWRGPVWFPVNFLIIESLQKFHHYYGADFKIEFPVGSRQYITVLEAAVEITERLTRLFLRDANGNRPCFGKYDEDADATRTSRTTCCSTSSSTATTGAGLGASHQTGWTALVAKLLVPRRGEKLYDELASAEAAPVQGQPAGVSMGKSARTGQQ